MSAARRNTLQYLKQILRKETMNNKHYQASKRNNMTRREFMRDGTLAAAGLAVGLGAVAGQGVEADQTKCKTDTVGGLVKTTRSYNRNMEYRRLGKTSLWISALSLGGHWKKLPYSFGTDDFTKNRRDVVTACIEHGINYIDACTDSEVRAYADALRGRPRQNVPRLFLLRARNAQ